MDAPDSAAFRTYFRRDFPFADEGEAELDDLVGDDDIARALLEASLSINERLFTSQDSFTTAFLYLAAHNLVVNIQNSTQGVLGQGTWLQSAKSVQGVSESFVIPERIQRSPVFAALSKTRYGMKYLEFVGPLLLGQVFVVRGRTSP